MTDTKGTGIMNHIFSSWEPWHGAIPARANGALVADRAGVATSYAIFNLQERGEIFIDPGDAGLRGHGHRRERQRPSDMDVNVTKEKKQTNMRASSADEAIRLIPPRKLGLEQAIEFINDDELVESDAGRASGCASGSSPPTCAPRPAARQASRLECPCFNAKRPDRSSVHRADRSSAFATTSATCAAAPTRVSGDLDRSCAQLGTDMGFVPLVIGACSILYLLTLLASGSDLLPIDRGGMSFLSPSTERAADVRYERRRSGVRAGRLVDRS